MLTFEYLSEAHTEMIRAFNCSDEPQVDLFLKEKALNLQLQKTAITRLYFDENQNVVGYFTLHNDLIQIFKNQQKKNKWQLPDELQYFPALKVYYLGVDLNFRRKYYGQFLIGEIFHIAKTISILSGCTFIALEAKENVVSFYEKYGFIIKARRHKLVDMIFNINDL